MTDVVAFWTNGGAWWAHHEGANYIASITDPAQPGASFDECWDGTWSDAGIRKVRFALAAWERATRYVAGAGHIRHHVRVLKVRIASNAQNDGLIGIVVLVTPWPEALARLNEPQRETRWLDWPTTSTARGNIYREPSGQELVENSYLMTSVTFAFPLSVDTLPGAPDGPHDDLDGKAHEATHEIVQALNRVVAPIIDALERQLLV
jgi:hypothetical protein